MFLPRSLMVSIPLVILQIENEEDRRLVLQLYDDYKDVMYKTALCIVHSPHVAEDIVQESCVAIIDNLDKIRDVEPCKQKAYVKKIAKNKAINYVTKRDRRSKYSFLAGDSRVFDQVVSDDEIDEALMKKCDSESIEAALLKLPVRERTILEMKYFHGLSDEEAAAYLNIKTDSVRYYFTLARRHMGAVLLEMGCL